MDRHRRTAAALLAALCACACAGAVSASAGTARHRASSPARSHSHRGGCARRSSFHSGRRRGHRRGARGSCRRHHHHHHHRVARPHAPSHARVQSAGSCPDASLTPSPAAVERLRAATLCLVNRERMSRGEQPLQSNGQLQHAAQEHTDGMAFGGYFEHLGPAGDTPLTRMRACGYLYSPRVAYDIGENIGWGSLWEGSPSAVVAAWMSSAGHRANILDPRFRDTAVGVSAHLPGSFAHGQPGAIYTQDFGAVSG